MIPAQTAAEALGKDAQYFPAETVARLVARVLAARDAEWLDAINYLRAELQDARGRNATLCQEINKLEGRA